MKTVSFVIAVYRNSASLHPTYLELKSLFSDGQPLAAYAPEFVFVDDGSDDGSLAELERIHAADPAVRVVSFSRNFGQIAAVVAGFREARGDVIVNKSADQQEPAEGVVAMLREWEGGADVVLGSRTGREDTFLANVLGNTYWGILRWLNPHLPAGADFFLLSRRAADVFNRIEESDRFFPVDVLWLGFRPRVVEYRRRRREAGRSQWSISKKVKAGIDGILHSSYLPIRLISLVGLLIAVIAFAATVGVVALRFFQGHRYPGWVYIVCLVLMLNGLTILILGLMSEYVWRIYNQVKHRPTYVVQRRLGE